MAMTIGQVLFWSCFVVIPSVETFFSVIPVDLRGDWVCGHVNGRVPRMLGLSQVEVLSPVFRRCLLSRHFRSLGLRRLLL